MAKRGENVTTYLSTELKARAVERSVPFAFALSTIVGDVLAVLDGDAETNPTTQKVLDEMARREL
jgi:hypothetical protein